MTKILLFARDPGGANTIIPLFEPLKRKGYTVSVYGKDIALARFSSNNIEAADIVSEVGEVSEVSIGKFLADLRPDFIITGTSADDMTEKYLWKTAESLGIPSFAILDQWMNYGIRFSSYGVSQIQEYEKDKNFLFLPSKILVPDDLARRDSILEGLPEDKILVSGQPYFGWIKNIQVSDDKIKRLRKDLDINNSDFIVVFASEPLQKIYKEEVKSYWGYDEISLFLHFYKTMVEETKITKQNIKIIVKLHPKEDPDYYLKLKSEIRKDNIEIIIDQVSDPKLLIRVSDLVVGISSMFLLESVVLGKPTISLQIGLKRENPFMLDRIGVLKSIVTKVQLKEVVVKALTRNLTTSTSLKLVKDPVNKIITLMEKKLCQN